MYFLAVEPGDAVFYVNPRAFRSDQSFPANCRLPWHLARCCIARGASSPVRGRGRGLQALAGPAGL
eukprot:9497500-Pyramimonas_sp.AAC.1